MIEFALGLIVGLLVMALIDEKIYIGKPRKQKDMSVDDKRAAEKAAREYANFMTYDGTAQDEFNG